MDNILGLFERVVVVIGVVVQARIPDRAFVGEVL